jgi:hypothetical protein
MPDLLSAGYAGLLKVLLISNSKENLEIFAVTLVTVSAASGYIESVRTVLNIKTIKMKQFLPLILIGILLCCCKSGKNDQSEYANHEDSSKNRYNEMQRSLDSCASIKDTNRIRLISARLDAQIKLEDFLIKFREVDQIKMNLFLGTGILTSIVSVMTTLITLYISRKSRKDSKRDSATDT